MWKELGCLVTTELIQLNDGQRECEPWRHADLQESQLRLQQSCCGAKCIYPAHCYQLWTPHCERHKDTPVCAKVKRMGPVKPHPWRAVHRTETVDGTTGKPIPPQSEGDCPNRCNSWHLRVWAPHACSWTSRSGRGPVRNTKVGTSHTEWVEEQEAHLLSTLMLPNLRCGLFPVGRPSGLFLPSQPLLTFLVKFISGQCPFLCLCSTVQYLETTKPDLYAASKMCTC